MEREPIDVCEVSVIHEDVLSRVRARMPDEEPVCEVAELFKVFGDTTRARIICALNLEEMCVCDLAALLSMSQSAISHQLRLLKVSRIVKSRKQGQIFAMAFDHVMEEMEG